MIDLRLMKILHNNGRLNKIYFFFKSKKDDQSKTYEDIT